MLKFRDDPDAESVLTYAAVEWVVKDISLDDVDWNESATNCARLWNPLNSEKISEYHTAMSQGDIFPRIVVEATKKGFVVLGGNQRSAAVKEFGKPWPSISAYVVRPLTTSQREIVIRSLNSRHGWGSSKEERIEHAVFLVMKHGVAVVDAAKLMVIGESTINEHIRAATARSRLAQKGVDAASLPTGTLSVISKLADEKTMVRVAKIAIEKRPTKEQTENVVKVLLTARNVAESSKAVSAFDSELSSSIAAEPKSGKTIRRPRRDRFYRALESLSEFLERGNDGTGFSSLDELQCTAVDSVKLIPLARKISIRLNSILEIK